jgi:hypothetical protein
MQNRLWVLILGAGMLLPLLATGSMRAAEPARTGDYGPTYDAASGGYYYHRSDGWYYYRPGEGWYSYAPDRGWQMYERRSFYSDPGVAVSMAPTYTYSYDSGYRQPRVRKFSEMSPYGAYSWRHFPFPQWDQLTLPNGD